MTITATPTDIKPALKFKTDHRIYKLSEPLQVSSMFEEATTEHLLVSALSTEDDFKQTAVWAVNDGGLLLMIGSAATVDGVADHAAALTELGVELSREEV